MRRFISLAAAIAGLALFATPAAVADPPIVETEIVIGGTDTFPSENPCTGVPGTVTIDFNSVFHITDQGSSQGLFIFHVTGTTTGTFTFVPDDPSEPSYTGHFTSWFGVQATPPGLGFVATDTFTVIAKGSDGSRLRFHITNQFTRLPSGEVVVSFSKPTCG
jgi:hypothetical protein